MVTKYCDHGAYGFSTFNGYISNTANNDNGVAGNTLTVTSVSGIINIGSHLSGGAMVDGTVISAFVSGTQGGVGVYTVIIAPVSATQIVRATNGLIGRYANPLSVPLTWALPQEGDGTSKTAASASAITSIDLAGVTAVAGNTVSIMGASLACVTSGAGNNQFNAAAGSTLAINLAAAINRSSNTATVAAQASGWATPKLQDTVYARASGTLLEVMTRAGSSIYNGLTSITNTGLTGWPGNPTWSGGSGGCWGHLLNHVGTYWPSGVAHTLYGPLYNSQLAGFVGSAALGGEDVYIRSAKVLRLVNASSLFVCGATGSITQPVICRFDDGTEWPADGVNPQIIIHYQHSGSTPSITLCYGNSFILKGRKYDNGQYSIKVVASPASTNGATYPINIAPGMKIEGLELDWSAGPYGGPQIQTYYIASMPYGQIAQCKDILIRTRSENTPLINTSAGYGSFELINVEVDAAGMSVPLTRVLSTSAPNGAGVELIIENLKFSNFPTNSRFSAVSDQISSLYSNITLSNTQWGAVTGRGPIVVHNPLNVFTRYNRTVQSYSSYGKHDFHLDQWAGYCEWDSLAGLPTCNARLLDGSPWVIKVIPARAAYATLGATQFLELPKLAKLNSLPDGIRTLTVELAAVAAVAWTKADISLLVTYQQTDGTVRAYDSYDGIATPLDDSTASWSDGYSASQVILNPGAVLHNKKQLLVTTPTAIKTDTEISVYLRIRKSVADLAKTILVDPDIAVA